MFNFYESQTKQQTNGSMYSYFEASMTSRDRLRGRGLSLATAKIQNNKIYINAFLTCEEAFGSMYSHFEASVTCGDRLRGRAPESGNSIDPKTTRSIVNAFLTCEEAFGSMYSHFEASVTSRDKL